MYRLINCLPCSQFQTLSDEEELSSRVHPGIVLAADKAAIDSDLQPTPQQDGFVIAIDAKVR
ncbi:hypothetical protein V8C37DRAFT_382317 [Trichoderma ceciliae]